MKASYNWLKEFIDFSISPKELAHALTMSGFEVEGVMEFEGDAIFDINVTPNRPDCLSIVGMAREISAILEIPLKIAPVEIKKQEGRGPNVEIKNAELCRRYAARLIHGVKLAPSPERLVKRLEAHGFKAICNVVDITNYVLLELGQPLHAFDLDKLAGRKIAVNTAGSETKFQTLDNEDRNLKEDMLLIWDAEKPVALAGVMGGLNTEVSSSTKNILLESAYFYPSSIRKASKSLGVTSESSYRFERGVDIDNVAKALDRAAQMIEEIAGGQVSCLTDIYPQHFTPKQIPVRIEKITSLLGIKIQESQIQNILNGLGFEIKREGEGYVVIPPSFRIDVQRDVDITEELARLYGYDKISATLPRIQMRQAPAAKLRDLINVMRNSMTKSGFSEVINYSFINPDIFERLNLPPDDKRRELVYIKNPLRKEESAMRTTLIPALLNNVSLNLNRGEKMLRFFEVSKVFLPSGNKLPNEVVQTAAVLNKGASASLWETRHDGFYDVKGALENLFRDLRIKDFVLEQNPSLPEPYLHPGKACSISISGEKIGALGAIHPSVSEAFDIKGNVIILEIRDVEKLLKHISPGATFLSLPKFPYVERDLAVIVSGDITVEQVRAEILKVDSGIIESVSLFDIYTGKPIPEDKKSLAFAIRYRSTDRTLRDEEVDSVHLTIAAKLKTALNAELRS
ncbi:MAG: phenylalanine--tRNA ligase subunit beta [Nitrospirae bacterium]|nr:phenylalanine--tRNA ligase subunit beta [Nitrospirota bacterium]